jgi:hypothetical protein
MKTKTEDASEQSGCIVIPARVPEGGRAEVEHVETVAELADPTHRRPGQQVKKGLAQNGQPSEDSGMSPAFSTLALTDASDSRPSRGSSVSSCSPERRSLRSAVRIARTQPGTRVIALLALCLLIAPTWSCGEGAASSAALVSVRSLPVMLKRQVSPANIPKWVAQLATGSDEIETSLGTISLDPSRLLGRLVHEGTVFEQPKQPTVVLIDKSAELLTRWDLDKSVERFELTGTAVNQFKLEVINQDPFQVLLWVDCELGQSVEITARFILRDPDQK